LEKTQSVAAPTNMKKQTAITEYVATVYVVNVSTFTMTGIVDCLVVLDEKY
jgi:hypothetical protein